MTANEKLDVLITKMDEFGRELASLKREVSELKQEVSELKQEVSELKQDVSELKQEVSELKQEVSELKRDVSDLKSRMTSVEKELAEWNEKGALKTDLAALQETVCKNYDMLQEFYVYQKEWNAETSDRLKIIEGRLDMHDSQIARNTADLKKLA